MNYMNKGVSPKYGRKKLKIDHFDSWVESITQIGGNSICQSDQTMGLHKCVQLNWQKKEKCGRKKIDDRPL